MSDDGQTKQEVGIAIGSFLERLVDFFKQEIKEGMAGGLTDDLCFSLSRTLEDRQDEQDKALDKKKERMVADLKKEMPLIVERAFGLSVDSLGPIERRMLEEEIDDIIKRTI